MQGGGPQWTSEIWYGKEDTTGGNTGDSSSGMGRIAWFDGKARKQVGDVTGFDTQIGVMQKDLLKCADPAPWFARCSFAQMVVAPVGSC